MLTLLLTIGFCVAVYRDTHSNGFVTRRVPGWAAAVMLPGLILIALLCSKRFVEILNFTGPVQRTMETAFEVLLYLCFTWFIVVVFNTLSDWVAAVWGAQKRSFDSGVLRVGVRVIGMLMAAGLLAYGASQVGVPLVGILAGLGVGGLAVALAAQPTMENLIGGLMIYADRPVRVGDHCKFGDQTGVIEEIGIRSTRIRNPDRSITSIPNGEFSKLRLTNFNQRDRMMFNTKLGLNYDAKGEQLRDILQRLRELLASHPKIQPHSVRVHLAAFASSAMEIDIHAEIMDTGSSELAALREDLLLRMLAIVEAAGTTMVGR